MKFIQKKGFVQKILIVLVAMILVNFSVPIQSQADSDFGGKLFQPIFQLLATIADVPIGFLQHVMVGTDEILDSVTLDENDYNVTSGIWSSSKSEHSNAAKPESSASAKTIGYNKDGIDGRIDSDGWFWTNREIDIPNILYCPEYIFANKIAALDVNFINPNTYKDAKGNDNPSMASRLTETVSSWYKALRNVAIVGLLSVLVYIGIRILIGSTAQDKAKYKERLTDWFIGLCLVFAMHYIMAGTMLISEVITSNLSKGLDDNMIHVCVDGRKEVGTPGPNGENDGYFKTNYMGYIRLMVQSENKGDALGYLIMYIALVIFTIMFTITYLKRVLYMAFFTIISPLVAMTYPLDKMADGSAQGFNMWFREYMLNAIIQPVHLVLYMIIMGSAIDLAVENPIYGLVAIGFLIPAEKFIKKMFRFDKGQTTSALGAVAGGALAMKGVHAVGGLARRIGGGKEGQDKVRTKETPELETARRGKNSGLESPEAVLMAENNNLLTSGGDSGESRNSRPGLTSAIGNDWASQNATAWENGGSINFANDNSYSTDGLDGNNDFFPTSEGNGSGSVTSGATPSTIRTTAMPVLSTQNPAVLATAQGGSTPNRWTRVKNSRMTRTAGVLAGSAGRSITRKVKNLPSSAGKVAIKGFKSLPRTAMKLGGTALGAGVLGTIAAGAAITTGDMQTGASMMAAGLMTGGKLGGSFGGRTGAALSEAASNRVTNVKEALESTGDREKQKQKRREKYDAEWRQREENYRYLQSKRLNGKQAKEWLNDERTQAFLNAGVTDINTIYNARKLMDESHNRINIDGAVARARLAQKVSDNFSDSPTERNAFRENMLKKGSSFNNENVEQLMNDIDVIKKKDN